MIGYFAVLLVCQLLGEMIAFATGIPIPGPVIGMGILFGALLIRGSVPPRLGAAAEGLLSHLSLLFVPAGVGVMTHAGLLGHELVPITASLIVSTLLTIAVTALVMKGLARRDEP